MKNFKNYMFILAGLMIMMVLVMAPISESKTTVGTDAIRLLATVAHNHAQQASQEASLAAENQRRLIKASIGKAIGGAATDDNKERQQPGRLTSREIAREKAMLQLLEANARRSAEVLESVKRLAAELDRQPRR